MPDRPMLIHIVDDEEAVRQSLAFLLEIHGFEVVVWSSAASLLASIGDRRPDCLISDLRMPDIDGVELLRLLGTRGIRLPAVVMTGHGDMQMAIAAMHNGATEVIEKPFDETAVIAAIARAVAAHDGDRVAVDEVRRSIGELAGLDLQILRGLVAGHPSKSIAIELGLSPTAVEKSRAALMQKLSARSLAELISKVLAADWAADDPGLPASPPV
jgi:two-component system, LuxR family, response regulator FixJ